MLVSAVGKLNTFNRGYVKSQSLACVDKKGFKTSSPDKDTFVKVSAKNS